MPRPGESHENTKLNALIKHLVLSFPQAAILSRSVGEQYHVCVIVPYDGSPEKALQVERALCRESARSIQEFERFLLQLNLPLIFQTHERYDVTSDNTLWPEEADQSPTNEGWPAERISSTVSHGPLPLSTPSAPTRPASLCHVSSN